jgi:hypothetical protein
VRSGGASTKSAPRACRTVGTRQPFKLTSTYDSRSLLDPDPSRGSPVVPLRLGLCALAKRISQLDADLADRERPICDALAVESLRGFGNRPAAWPGCSRTRHSAPRRNFSASGYKFTITPCTTKDGPSWGRWPDRRCGPAGGTDLPGTVRSSPRSDGSRTLRFVVDLPANHLGPGWRKKLAAAG